MDLSPDLIGGISEEEAQSLGLLNDDVPDEPIGA